jgi:hypothetical protein
MCNLSEDNDAYSEWKAAFPDMSDFFQMFPNAKIPAAILVATLNKLIPRA